jgi:two-component system, NtrC family, response regulator HydG
MIRGKIVLVDDNAEMRSLMHDFLKNEGYEIREFALATEAFTALQKDRDAGHMDDIDVIVSDIQMPEMDGFEFIQRVKRLSPDIPVILVTAFGSIASAIEATRNGAFDYLVKPFQLSEFAVRIERAYALRKLRRENQVLRQEMRKGWSHYDMIGKSKAMREIFNTIDRIAKATANVLVTGESGTGKEVVARAIHERGPRALKPFVAINCTAIPDTLLESELFGHAKGSFTGAIARKKGLFEEAEGGTIFLDEIGDMDLGLQAKLLRVLQERRIRSVGDTEFRDIDVRIISATHKDLVQAVRDGRFREDLFYRLSVIPVSIPPLRHRKEDIPTLANYFLQKYAASNRSQVKGFTAAAMNKLVSARWEGNVRELENLVERMIVLAQGEFIDLADIPTLEQKGAEDLFAQSSSDLPTVEQLERRYIIHVLERVGGRKEKAAQILGINRRTLYRKEREYGLVVDQEGVETSEPFVGETRSESPHSDAPASM